MKISRLLWVVATFALAVSGPLTRASGAWPMAVTGATVRPALAHDRSARLDSLAAVAQRPPVTAQAEVTEDDESIP